MHSSTSNSNPTPPTAAEVFAPSPPPKRLVWCRGFWWKLAAFIAVAALLDYALAAVLQKGLDKYFGLDKPCQALLVGHSHMVLGVDGDKLGSQLGAGVAKYGLNGVNTFDRQVMIRQYFESRKQPPEVVIYDVDAWTFTAEGLAQSSYKQFYPYIDYPCMGQYVRQCESIGDKPAFGKLPRDFQFTLRQIFHTLRYDDNLVWCSLRGYLGYRENLKRGTVNLDRVRHDIALGKTRPIEIDPDNVKTFEKTLAYVRSHGAKMVLLYIPTLDLLNQVQPDRFAEVMRRLEGYAAADSGVIFLDYNKDMQSRHELFFDPVHMNPAGRAAVTERLATDLRPVLSAHLAAGGGATK